MQGADLSSAAARARQEQTEAAGKPPEVVQAEFAYIVYKRKDTGAITVTKDLDAAITTERGPTHDDVIASGHIIQKDLIGQQYAGMAAQASLQLNTFMAGQIANQKELQPVLEDLAGTIPGMPRG